MKRPRALIVGRSTLYVLASLLVIYLASPSHLSAWRMNAAKKRALMDTAARDVMRHYPPSIELARRPDGPGRSVVTYGRPEGAIPYASAEEFYAVNPDCCALVERGAEGWEPSLLDWVLGYQFYIVRVRYAIRAPDKAGAIRTIPEETFVLLNRAGAVTHN
ncbi:hypothetical protein [Dyella sp. 20L07]|uniref:hypothetical protein n=1 Tax=Dyella sp. 20L07 TaxID=3384240 RepID=UPI003D2B3EC4